MRYYLEKLNVKLARQFLFVSDGAKWIWERLKKLVSDLGLKPSQCKMALDYYHAVEHLTKLAALKRWTKPEQKKWVNTQKRCLLNGKLERFMDEVNAACRDSKNNKLKCERAYFHNHLAHMHYHDLKAQGLPIGSGAVESGIRRVVNMRLKGPGIFWHEEVANAMLMLRSYYKAGRWDLLKNTAFSGALLSV